MGNVAVLTENIPVAELVTAVAIAKPLEFSLIAPPEKSFHPPLGCVAVKHAFVPMLFVPWIGRVERSVPSFQH